ncbi:hypothetical protein H8K90_06390 [Winogradskyella echinorum]|uniref:Uncharacterized protein n=1 Tax=Winogradskyella echinorum TaxID=538189 RepID=A0ABR6Y030_9FLAO|nr:hypothetical protein [Winogradskyella echinorum]MBC3845999.1 hypothetical protein [Winogradskyella echinorum]MBC5750347.1 hypothetical protein [Winogradskyella echinorum]
MKKIFKIILFTPFLLAMQCDDDSTESTLIFNDYNVYITPQSSFSVNDTIWLEGIVSSKAYDLAINDSIIANRSTGDTFSIMKFIEPTQSSNCKDAIDKFELIYNIGLSTFLPICENAQMTLHSEISNDNLSYKYKIGLKALDPGDYVVSWQNSIVKNENRNEYIIENYPIEHHANQIGYNKCGNVSWRFLNESDKEYYFSIE